MGKKYKDMAKAIFEMFEMTRTPRSGWQRVGVRNGIENNAEHNCLTIQIAFILALMEKVDNPEKTACIAFFHDNAEPRTGDQNKINAQYFDKTEGERRAFDDFTNRLPGRIKGVLLGYMDEYKGKESVHAIIVKDADLLQMGFQAKYYLSIGFKHAQKYLDTAGEGLQTKSAKRIYKSMLETEFYEWSLE